MALVRLRAHASAEVPSAGPALKMSPDAFNYAVASDDGGQALGQCSGMRPLRLSAPTAPSRIHEGTLPDADHVAGRVAEGGYA